MIDWLKIKDALHKGTATVTFKKVDGSIRVMECTLADYLLPEIGGSGRPTPDHLLVVFDLDANNWRSFRKDSVISVELNETGEIING